SVLTGHPPLEGEGRTAEGSPGWGGSARDTDPSLAARLSPPPGPPKRADLPPPGGGDGHPRATVDWPDAIALAKIGEGAEGTQTLSSATMTWSTCPAAASLRAFSSRPNKLTVTTVRAPLSVSLWTSSRSASSGLRWTTWAPARSAPKNPIGCQRVFGR